MNACKDCKHYVPGLWFIGKPTCCGPQVAINQVTGKQRKSFAEVQRSFPATPGYCNPAGEYFEPK